MVYLRDFVFGRWDSAGFFLLVCFFDKLESGFFGSFWGWIRFNRIFNDALGWEDGGIRRDEKEIGYILGF